MNFEEALEASAEGKNIRMKLWRGQYWNVYYPEKFSCVKEPKMVKPDSAIFVTDEMRDSQDWEIAE